MKPICGFQTVPIQVLDTKYFKLEFVWKPLVSEIQEF